jgi:uncharacterized protein
MSKKQNRVKEFFRLDNSQLRYDADEGKIIGFAAVYDQEAHGERVAPGAFTKTIQESKDIKGLYNHDANIVLGSTGANPPTMTLRDTPQGLEYEILAPKWADNIRESIERGDIAGSSFGFYPIKTSVTTGANGKNIRQIDEVALIDVGPVTFPWYDQTSTGVRNLEEHEIREYTITNEDKEILVGDIIDEWQERHKATQEPFTEENTQEPEYVAKPLSLLRNKLELKRKAL